jgi:hypothetical protein
MNRPDSPDPTRVDPLSLAADLMSLARMDGFDDLASMLAFWADADRLPFTGQIIFWAPLRDPTNVFRAIVEGRE